MLASVSRTAWNNSVVKSNDGVHLRNGSAKVNTVIVSGVVERNASAHDAVVFLPDLAPFQ